LEDPVASPDDWTKVGYNGNPVSGNPGVIDDIARDFRHLQDLAAEAARGLDAFLLKSENGGFEGQTADGLRDYIQRELRTTFVPNIQRSFDQAASAAERYANALRDAQGRADSAARRGGAVAIPPAGVVAGDAPPLWEAVLGLVSGKRGLPPELTAAKNDVRAEVDFITGEAKILENALEDAAKLVSKPVPKPRKSGWQKFWQALEIIALVVSILAIVFTGPLGLMALGLNAAIFLKAVADYASGKTDARGLGLAALGLLGPSTKGLTTFGKMAGLFKTAAAVGSRGLRAGARAIPRILAGSGHLVLQGGKLLLRPDALAAMTGRALTRFGGLTARGLSRVPGLTARATRMLGGALRSLPGFLKGTWQQGRFALRRDFFMSTAFVGGSTAKRLGVYAVINAGRAFDLAVSAVLPVRYGELAAFGYRGAFRTGFLERGLLMRPSVGRSISRGTGAAGGSVFDLTKTGLYTPGAGRPGEDIGKLVLPGTEAWDDAIGDLAEFGPPPTAVSRTPGVSSLSSVSGISRATPGRFSNGLDDLAEPAFFNDLDTAGSSFGRPLGEQGIDVLDLEPGGLLPPQTRWTLDTLDTLDELGSASIPGPRSALLEQPRSAVTRLRHLDSVMGLDRTGAGLLKPVDDLPDLAELGLDGDFGGLSAVQVGKILDGEIDLVKVTPDGVVLRIGKTDPVDIQVRLKDEVTVRVLDPAESVAGLPSFAGTLTGPHTAGPGIKLDDLVRLLPDAGGDIRRARELLGLGPVRTGHVAGAATTPTGFPPLTLREVITGGEVGRTATERFHAWLRVQDAEMGLDTAGRELSRLTELPDVPPLNRAQAELDLSAAELRFNEARMDFEDLGLNLDTVRQNVTVMMARMDGPAANLPIGELHLTNELGHPTGRWITMEGGESVTWVVRSETGIVPGIRVEMADDGFLLTGTDGIVTKIGPGGQTLTPEPPLHLQSLPGPSAPQRVVGPQDLPVAPAVPAPSVPQVHWLVRQDIDFTAQSLKSGLKTRLTEEGLVPVRLDGTTTPLQAVTTVNAKAFKENSPFTAFSPPATLAKPYGTNEIGLDLAALSRDIRVGADSVKDVEIVSNAQLQRAILDEIRQRVGNPQLDVPPHFTHTTGNKDIQNLLTGEYGITKGIATKVTPDIKALLQVRRDNTWLVRGAVPKEYLTGPYPAADSLKFVPDAPSTPLAPVSDLLDSAGRASGSGLPSVDLPNLAPRPDHSFINRFELEELRGVRLVRQDNVPFQRILDVDKGLVKSHFDPAVGMIPANPTGLTSAFDHVRGAQNVKLKSDSPFTSFAEATNDAHKVYGNFEFTLDAHRLGADIKAGRLAGVGILPARDLQQLIREQLDWTIRKQLDFGSLRADSSTQDVIRFLKENDVTLVGRGGKDMGARIAHDVRALLNTTRDQEWLVKGVIPRAYLDGPNPTAAEVGAGHVLDEAAGDLRPVATVKADFEPKPLVVEPRGLEGVNSGSLPTPHVGALTLLDDLKRPTGQWITFEPGAEINWALHDGNGIVAGTRVRMGDDGFVVHTPEGVHGVGPRGERIAMESPASVHMTVESPAVPRPADLGVPTDLAITRLTPFDGAHLSGVGDLAGRELRITHVTALDGSPGPFRLDIEAARIPPPRGVPDMGPRFTVEGLADGGFRVTDPAGTARWEFDAGGAFAARETALVDRDLGLPSDLWFRVTKTSVAPDGMTSRFVGLVGRDSVSSAVSDSFRLTSAERSLQERLPGGFTLTETVTGGRFHFDAHGTLMFRDLPARDDSGFLRFTEGTDVPPTRLDDLDDASGHFTDGSLDDLTRIFHRTLDEASGVTRPVPDADDLALGHLRLPDGTVSRLGADSLPELDDAALRARLDEHWQTLLDAQPVIRPSGVDDLADFEIRTVRVPGTDTEGTRLALELVHRDPAADSALRGSDFAVERMAGGEYLVTHPTGTTSWLFDDQGHFLARETVLSGEGLPTDLPIVVRMVTGAGGEALTDVEVRGTSGVLNSMPLTPTEGALAGHLPGGFTLTDSVTGSRFHFDRTGRLAFRDLPARDGSGFLRFTEGAPGTPPTRLVDPLSERFPLNSVPEEGFPDEDFGDVAQIFERTLDEASGTPHVPEGAATDLSGIAPAMDFLHAGADSPAFRTPDLPQIQQLAADATQSLDRFGLGPGLLHDQLRAMTSQAHLGIRQGAATTLREYLDLPLALRLEDLRNEAGRALGDFTVTPTPHGGPGGSRYTVTHTGTDLSTGFGPNGERLHQEIFLRGGPDGVDGLKVQITGRTAEGGTWTPDAFTFAGAHPAGDTLTITRLAPQAPAELRGGFTITDASGVTKWHYGPEGMAALRDVRLPADRGGLRFDVGAPHGAPQALDRAGLASTALRVERLDDGRIALSSTGAAAHAMERAVFDSDGGRLLEEFVAVRGKAGGFTGEFWKIDHAAGKAVRTDGDGTALTGTFHTATVERSGTGQFRLTSTSQGKVPLFEREVLKNGNTLHIDWRPSGRARWSEFDAAGNRLRHGLRIGDVNQRTFHDVTTGTWRPLNTFDVRTYNKAVDGGLVRAEKGADGHWTWQRFDKSGAEVLSGERHWSWNHVAFQDTYRDPATGLETVAQQRGQTWPFDGLHGSGMYKEHTFLPGHAPAGARIDPGDYTGFNPANAQIERMEALADGGSLLVARFADMRPPAFMWKGAAGRNPFDGFFRDLFGGESLNRVSYWTETATDGTKLTGVRLHPTGSNWVDLDQYGRVVREVRKLENGHVIEVGRSLETPARWAPAPEYHSGASYELHWKDTTSGQSGIRHVDGDGRWKDVFTDPQGIERVRLRGEGVGAGTREYLYEAPTTEELRLHDNAGLWVDRNAVQHLSGRRDLVDGRIVESSGNPYRSRWTWKAYDPAAPETVVGEGLRKQNRGSVYALPWDDSFKDFDLAGNLVRERNATDTGSSWIDAVKQQDSTWKWTKRADDGTVHSEGVRVHDDLDAGRWRDLVDDQVVRQRVGERVREFKYEIVTPDPVTPPAHPPVGRTLRDLLDASGRHEAPATAEAGRLTLRDLLADASRHFEPPVTVRVDPDVWKEFDAGKVFREKVSVDGVPGRYRVIDKQWGQWAEFQNNHLVQWRTVDGRVWSTDAFGRFGTSGRARILQFLAGGLPRIGGEIGLPGARGGWARIGREADFRGMDVEVMGHLREIQDVRHGPFTGFRNGDVVEMPMWQRELRSGLTSFGTGFVTDLTAGLAITAATNNGTVTDIDVYKALLSGTVGGTFGSGLNLLYNQTRLGLLKTHMGVSDWGGHPNQTMATQTDDWATEFAAQDKATRWRSATYANTVGLATGALSGFVSTAISSAVFGVNGHEIKGWDALKAGAWGAAGSLFGGVSTGLARNAWHLSTGSRVFHKGGLGELGMNWAESALSRYLSYEITQAAGKYGGDLPSPGRAFPRVTPAPPLPPPPPPAPDRPASPTT